MHCSSTSAVKAVYKDLKGPRDGGLCRQVVLEQRCISIIEVAHGAAYNGLCRQVVLIQGYLSITMVSHGSAYSGQYGPVVKHTHTHKVHTMYTAHTVHT